MRIVSREDWGAAPARRTSKIPTPSPEAWLHHTVGLYRGRTGMRKLQRDHFARGFRDVGYSFVIDSVDFTVYEGAGPGILGAHTRGHNSRSHGIAVTGNFENLNPSPALLARIGQLVAYGHEKGWWPPELTGGHRDTKSTACPGSKLYPKIPVINEIATRKDTTMETHEAEGLVHHLYEKLLAREADPAGFNYWVGLLVDGTADENAVRWAFMDVAMAEVRLAMNAVAEHASSGSSAPLDAAVRAAVADYHAQLLAALKFMDDEE